VLTGRGTDAKYDGSYEEIARVIKDVIAPPFRKEALRTLFAAVVMNHFLKNGDGHLKNYGILYENDYTDARLAPVYDVITTTVYIQKDIPALKLGDSKRWWGEKSYKNFAKLSCGLSRREYDEILKKCTGAIRLTRQEIEGFEAPEARDFLHRLQEAWGDRLS
jgi:serine/threonine-protein kinase HipA